VVVDTDGWVQPWRGLYSKIALAEIILADMIVLIGVDDWVFKVFTQHFGEKRVFRIPKFSGVKEKSRDERRTHRERMIAKRLIGAKEYSVNVDSILLIGSPIFRGEPLNISEAKVLVGEQVLYAERQDDELIVVARRKPKHWRKGVTFLPEKWEVGLVASAQCNGEETIAMVTGVNYRSRRIKVRSQCKPQTLMLGVDRVKLT
jgi:polynucleotide 5'-kinase involved in rRNA processing